MESTTAAGVLLLVLLLPAAPAAGQQATAEPTETATAEETRPPAENAAPAVTDPASPAPADRPGTVHPAHQPLQHPAPPSERLTVPSDPGPILEILPFGTGLACLGLGLGMVGLRMRRG